MESGEIKITRDGIGQDARQAMRGDIFRGLVELITNCDDAYPDDQENQEILITIDFDADPLVVSVKDNAKGLTAKQLRDYMSLAGGSTSGHAAGENVRGLFGRGAKDVAIFGSVKFETIRNNKYSWLEIDGHEWTWKGNTDQPETVTKELREKLGIPNNGFIATVTCSAPGLNLFKTAKTWISRLTNHVQLRQISQRRNLKLAFRENNQSQVRTLLWTEPGTNILLEEEIQVSGFSKPITVHLLEIEEPSSNAATNEYSAHGIEIRGNRATYENTIFSLPVVDGRRISGYVDCPMIDDYIRDSVEADKKGTAPKLPDNETLIIKRDRDGLIKSHPFYKHLEELVTPMLQEIVRKWHADTVGVLSDDLAATLNELELEFRDIFLEELDDLNEVAEETTDEVPLALVPTSAYVLPGKRKSFTVQIHESIFEDGLKITVDASKPSNVGGKSEVEILSVGEFSPHPNYAKNYIAVVQIQVKDEAALDGTETLTVSYGPNSSTATIIISELENAEKDPEGLEWKNEGMSVTLQKQRSVTLRAPVGYGSSYRAMIIPESIDSGVVLVETDSAGYAEIDLKQVKQGWLEGQCLIQGLSQKVGEKQKILAWSSEFTTREDAMEADADIAIGSVEVTSPSSNTVNLEIKPSDEELFGEFRANVEQPDVNVKSYTVWFFTKHPALKAFYEEDQESPLTKNTIREIVVGAISDFFVQEQDRKKEGMTAADLLNNRNRLVDRFLRVRTG